MKVAVVLICVSFSALANETISPQQSSNLR